MTSQNIPDVELINRLKDHGTEETLWVTAIDDHPNAKANDLISDQLKLWVLENAGQPRSN